jgi:hypothetical protein
MAGHLALDPLVEMERFKKNGGVEWLKNVGLKSVHFTTFVAGDTSMFDEEELELLEDAILEDRARRGGDHEALKFRSFTCQSKIHLVFHMSSATVCALPEA